MNEDPPTSSNNDHPPDDPVEARIVAWVLGEASAFEAAELERLCEEKPELLVFRRRMRALHGLLTEAEATEPDESWKLPAEKRRVLDEIFGEEKVPVLVPDLQRERRISHSGRRAALAIAACVVVTFFVIRLVPFKHEAEAVIEIRPRTAGLAPSDPGFSAPENELTPQFFGTEFNRIKSRKTLGEVVDRLSLTTRWGMDREAAINRVRDSIETTNLRDTDLVSVRVRESSEADAREITRAVVQSYAAYRADLEKKDAEKALAELNKAVRDQEDKVEERRKVLATIVRTKGIIYKGQDSSYGNSGVDEDQGARGALETYNQLQQEKMQLESQVNSLLKYDDDQLLTYASGLELPDNLVRNLYPQYLEGQRQLDQLKSKGLGEDHPTVKAAQDQIGTMKKQLDEGAVNLRATLQAQLDMASERLKNVESLKDDNREDAIKRGLDAQDYVDAKRDFESDQELLQQMRLKQIDRTIRDKMPDDSIVIHEMPEPVAEKRVDFLPSSPAKELAVQEKAEESHLAQVENAPPAVKGKARYKVDREAKTRTRESGLMESARQQQLAKKPAITPAEPQASPAAEAAPLPELAKASEMKSMPLAGTGTGSGLGVDMPAQAMRQPRPRVAASGGSTLDDKVSAGAPAEPGFDMVDRLAGKDAVPSPGTVRAGAQLSQVPTPSDVDLSKLMKESGSPKALTDTATPGEMQYLLSEVEREPASDSFADTSIQGKKESSSAWQSEGMALTEEKPASLPAEAVALKAKDAANSVKENLYQAEGNFNLGKYDDAKKEYEDVLKQDPYNSAARRGLERVASATSDYYRSAYDHTRAELLSQADASWELSVPAVEDSAPAGDVDKAKNAAEENSSALGQTATPSLYFYRGSDLALIEEDRETLEKKAVDLEKQIAGSPDDASKTAKFREWQAINLELIRRAKLEKEKQAADVVEETSATENPYSTFSLNISDASFQLAKAALAKGERPDPASIKPEQFYNAVDYGDPAPAAGEPVAATIEQSIHPVIPGRSLVRVAVRTGASGRSASQPLRLTLLVDQSGSMVREDRRAAMERALAHLGTLLTKADVVNVIGFSRTPHLLADGLTGDQSAKLGALVNQTANEGGTNLEEALKLGSELATRHHLAAAQNRIVLFTDGAANLGDADPGRLAAQVKTLRQKGIAFDVAGIAANDLNDHLLSELARNGNGRYYVVGDEKDDSFARQLAGAFRPAAENVKIQVIFNPRRVAKYKLIGFEKDRLRTEDFRNDSVDAAELAAEETGTAIYQVEEIPEGAGEIGELSVRFRDTASGEMFERSWTMPHESTAKPFDRATPSMQLAGLSLLAAEKLRGGPLGDAIDFKQLTDTIGSVKQFYGFSSRAADMLRLIDSIK